MERWSAYLSVIRDHLVSTPLFRFVLFARFLWLRRSREHPAQNSVRGWVELVRRCWAGVTTFEPFRLEGPQYAMGVDSH
jgi:hypothetical protein